MCVPDLVSLGFSNRLNRHMVMTNFRDVFVSVRSVAFRLMYVCVIAEMVNGIMS